MSATDLGKAYVQIMPSAKGISGRIQNAIDPEATSAGKSAGNKIGGLIVKGIAVAGIGLAIRKSIDEGAKLEQSIGGIETLFKGTADVVKKYADEAYKTVGMSANDYMENVTSFSASLLQSLGGDTDKAAEVANRAMIDMGDNANKMGTDMRDIQNAYQGFAKQNYTMLDNLKLGYGGTKKEMERLLADATKLSGVKYDIENLADVYTAVGVIQDQLNITGTTALEAEETISGSLNAMKSSFTNVLGKLALGQDIQPSLKALSKTMSTFLFGNLIPMIGNIVSALPSAIITFFAESVPIFMEAGGGMLDSITNGFASGFPNLIESTLEIIDNIANFLTENAPIFIQKGFEMLSQVVEGITNALPILISKVPEIITKFAMVINDNFPTILAKGFELIVQLIKGIISAIPTLIQNIPQIIEAIWQTILAFNWLNLGKNIIDLFGKGIKSMVGWVKSNAGEIFQTVWQALANLPTTLWNLAKSMISKFGSSISGAVGSVRTAVSGIFNAVWNGFTGLPAKMASIGGDVVRGLWNGINNVKDWILGKISGFVNSIVGGIKSFFGIKSPSRVMANEVGKFLPSGLAVGIEANTKPLLNTMEDLSTLTVDSFDPDYSINHSSEQLQKSLKTPSSNVNNVTYNNHFVLEGTYHIREENDMEKIVRDLSREIERKIK